MDCPKKYPDLRKLLESPKDNAQERSVVSLLRKERQKLSGRSPIPPEDIASE